MLNKDQTTGIAERVLYGVLLGFAMKFVEWDYIDAQMAAYIAAGALSFLGALYAWWINRPAALMNAATNQLPDNSDIVITTTSKATGPEKAAAHALAKSSNERVMVKTLTR